MMIKLLCRLYDPQEGEMVRKCLVEADFGARLTSMEKGLDTYLYKDYDDEGVEISGGEAQKIAIARAVYKEAPFILLDEPKAALDPLAEYEIYSNFDKLAGTKKAVYISHRLSSCRFCEKIAVFHKGSFCKWEAMKSLWRIKTGSIMSCGARRRSIIKPKAE